MKAKKLQSGDQIRVIAPACSANVVTEEIKEMAIRNLEHLGLKVSFGERINNIDEFDSSSVEDRLSDLHQAFKDPDVNGILSVLGGFNSNQLLRYIDWNLIKENPKIICGYSDITALCNAIYSKTDLLTYSGMHFSSFGQKYLQPYGTEYFKKCLFSEEPYTIIPSEKWSDDEWYKDQNNRNFKKNEGWWILNEGEAKGIAVGGNAATIRLLYGTEYMPNIQNSIFFIEDDNYTSNDIGEFDRNLQSLIHQHNSSAINALLIGRFQSGSKMSKEKLTKIIKTKKELNNIPVIGNLDFGHTDPLFTFPIGGSVEISTNNGGKITFTDH